MPLQLLDHPLAQHLLTHLRDRRTVPATFRVLSHQLTTLLVIEATRRLPVRVREVETPLEPFSGCELSVPLAVVPILRAGLAMLQPVTDLFPQVDVGYIGLERSHDEVASARRYYSKLPPLTGKHVLLLDPMLATGGSAAQAMRMILAAGPASAAMICVIAAPEGLARLAEDFPELPVHAAAVDRCLDERKYIRPGIGDYGDRLYGT